MTPKKKKGQDEQPDDQDQDDQDQDDQGTDDQDDQDDQDDKQDDQGGDEKSATKKSSSKVKEVTPPKKARARSGDDPAKPEVRDQQPQKKPGRVRLVVRLPRLFR